MAVQQQGGLGFGQAQGQDHPPPATEYTLQGVMRFLQLEWHSHERARNAWDIDRAEMIAKIAKQEGQLRCSRRINDQLERQIKMLEVALRNERSKTKDTAKTDLSSASGRVETNLENKQVDKHSGHDHFSPDQTIEQQDEYRDTSKKYLERCMEEIQYLLAPPPHPPPPPQIDLPNGHFSGILEAPPALPPPIQNPPSLRQQRPFNHLHSINQQNTPRSRIVSLPDRSYEARPEEQRQQQYRDESKSTRQESVREMENHLTTSDDVGSSDMAQQERLAQVGIYVPPRLVDGSEKGIKANEQAGETWNFDDQSQQISNSRPDTDDFPTASPLALLSPRKETIAHRRRSSNLSNPGSLRRKSFGSQDTQDSGIGLQDPTLFKVKYALRGHLDVVRSVIFTGGGSPSEPEICTAGDDGLIKRWIIPSTYGSVNDLDISAYFTHRGHEGLVTSLASFPSSSFSTGGRVSGDGWIFSGGQDATVRVWERGRVDPKATLDGHTDVVWSVCVLPGTCGAVFGTTSTQYGAADRIILVSGSADGSIKVWTVSSPPQSSSPQVNNSRRGVGGSRRHSVTSGSNHPSSPQPNTATNTPFSHTLVHNIVRNTDKSVSPTCICPLSPNGDNFIVAYTDASIIIYDTRTGEEIRTMASNDTYDGTIATSINAIAATSNAPLGAEGNPSWAEEQEDAVGAGPTGSAQGVEGVIISGHEDRYIRFFDANSGQCTYTMLAHPAAISSLSLSHDGHEAVSAGHDASIRFWSLDKRICTQDIAAHKAMRGEGVCGVVWSPDGRYVVSAGGDGVVKVYSR